MYNYYRNNITKAFFLGGRRHRKVLRRLTKIFMMLQSQLNQKELQVPFTLSAFSNIQEYLGKSCVT